MFTFRRVKIQNFVGLADIELEFSADPSKPLTVIRAENGSGKTTFLRALAWGLYGERAVPYPGTRWPLHTIDWDPDDGPQDVVVSIEFSTDASARPGASSTPVRYELTRTVTVVPRVGADPNWARTNERVRLMRHTPGSGWDDQPGAGKIVEELIPWDLREFFFTDADKAEDFLGGPEGGEQLTHAQLVARTTGAVRALLSLDVLRDAAVRAEKRADAYRKRLSRSIGDQEIADLQADVEKKKEDRDNLRETNRELNEELSNLRDSLDAQRASLEIALKGTGAYEELAAQMEANRVGIQRATDKRKSLAARASDALGSPQLFAALVHRTICSVHDGLAPMEKQGLIPLRHLPFVRDRLENVGFCICGTDIRTPGKPRNTILQLISDSEDRERKANFLGDVFNETRYYRGLAAEPASFWPDMVAQVISDLGAADEELAGLTRQKEELQERLKGIKLELVEELKQQVAHLGSEVERKELKVRKSEADLEDLEDEIESKSKTLRALTRKLALDKDALRAMTVAEDATALMRRTYRRVATDQVGALSDRMNALFREMIAAASGEVIHRVGIKESAPEEYEIFAEKRNGDFLHVATMVNGASRRALAMAFILALAEQSGTQAPTVCDSLLNNTSGSVREGTFSVTVNNSSQPILLMTRDEIHGVQEPIRQRAGKTFTLTAQWQADAEDGREGDVVRRTGPRPVTLVCSCGIDEYCAICERRHDREANDLHARST